MAFRMSDQDEKHITLTRKTRKTPITRTFTHTAYSRNKAMLSLPNASPAVLPNGQRLSDYPSLVCLQSKPLPYHVEQVTITGFGMAYGDETEFSHLAMVVETPRPNANATFVTKRVANIDGKRMGRTFTVKKDEELLEALVPGSIVRVLIVGPPMQSGKRFYGPSIYCNSVRMNIYWCVGKERFDMAVVHENLIRRYIQQQQQHEQQDTQQQQQQQQQQDEPDQALSFVFEKAPKNVFTNIVKFAYS